MGKSRDLFKKIRDIKGTLHAKMGSIKDRNGMDLTEAEDIKKRWQEYTEDYTKKIFTTQIVEARLQQYMNRELQIKLDLVRQRNQRSNGQHLLDQ